MSTKPDRYIVMLSIPREADEDPPDEWIWDEVLGGGNVARPVFFLGMSEDIFHDDKTDILEKFKKRPQEPEEKPLEFVHTDVKDDFNARRVATALINESQWFEIMPLPDDYYRVKVRADYGSQRLHALILRAMAQEAKGS